MDEDVLRKIRTIRAVKMLGGQSSPEAADSVSYVLETAGLLRPKVPVGRLSSLVRVEMKSPSKAKLAGG